MSHTKTIKTIFKMESKKFFQNPKNILSSFLAGPLLIFAILFLFTQLSSSSTSTIKIYSSSPVSESIISKFENVEFCNGANEYKEQIKEEGNIVAIVENEDSSVSIYYDSSLLSDTTLLFEAKKIASNFIVMRENFEEYENFSNEVNNIHMVNLNNESDSIYTIISTVTSLLFFISLMSLSSTICNLSIDAICGERERGTFDTLILSGLKPNALVLGKMTFTILIGFIILLLNSIAIGFGLCFTFDGVFEYLKMQLTGNYTWFLAFFILFFEISLLESTLFFAVSTSFEKVKQAIAYTGIVQIVLSLFSYAPSVFGNDALAYIPISNVMVAFDAMLNKNSYWGYVIGSSIIVFIFTALLYIYSVNILRYGEMKK